LPPYELIISDGGRPGYKKAPIGGAALLYLRGLSYNPEIMSME